MSDQDCLAVRSHGYDLSRAWLVAAGTALTTVVGIVVAAKMIDLRTAWDAVVAADRRLLAGAVVVYLCSWLCRGRRYQLVLASTGRRCGVGFLTAVSLISQTINLVVPARAGDAVRAYLLSEYRAVPYPIGVASLVLERLADLVALAALGGVAVAWLRLGGQSVAINHPDMRWVGVGAAGATALLMAAFAVDRADRSVLPAVYSRVDGQRLPVLVRGIIESGQRVRGAVTDRQSLVAVTGWSLAVWGLDVGTALVILVALAGTPVPGDPTTIVLVATLAVGAGNLAKVLPLSQGGIGLYEGAVTGVIASLTPVSAGVALAVAVLDHGIKNVVTLLGGGAATAVLGRRPDQPGRPDDADTVETGPPRF
ncbi:MAG: hypothetical protein J07HX5_00325 [halophilic archaeon J07HX5]|jgi:conserved hypothetical protein|nr:MAG: hypothetical protein J07HX5_00325 [halophilic archaeon J07HX5]